MNNINEQNLSMENVGNMLQLSQLDISTCIDFIVHVCSVDYFDATQSIIILQKLNKLKNFREYFQYKDHPSLPKILCEIGSLIAETSQSQLALPFFVEQLRIEKYYLGSTHPDLASVLFSIGQVYEKNDQLVEGKKCFMEAFALLNNHGTKGQLYASLAYNIGLINFRQTSYKDAMEQFDLAITEYYAAYGDFHPAVAEVRMKIGYLQLEIGKLQDAMNNFLEALVILRIVLGNENCKVAQCLYGIGLIHEAKAEFIESLNVLSQALSINENAEDDDDEDDTFSLVLLHRIGLIYQSIEDIDKAIKVFENLKNIIKLKFGDEKAEEKLLSTFGLSIINGSPQAAAAA